MVLLPLILACQDDGVRPELPDWSDGYESDCCPGGDDATTDGPTIPYGDTFGLFAAEWGGYRSRVHRTGATNVACEVEPGADPSGYQQMDCTLDVPELDLYGAGLYFDFTVPEGACDHLVYMHYMYEAWEVGVGPTEVVLVKDADGNILSEVNAVGGNPYCAYNYSFYDSDAPNCCLGSYIVYAEDAETGARSIDSSGNWDGNPADCYAGAAYEDPEAVFTADGWPTQRIVNLWGAPFSKRFQFDLLGDLHATNVNYANYFDRADHDGSVPAGFTGDWVEATYRFACYDAAEELLARLDLVVREWNEVDEWEADGDPDSDGTEPTTGLPLNDRRDWADATPGSTTWIQNAQ